MEEIRKEFPKMPDEMRAMVEREVAKQMGTEQIRKKQGAGENAGRKRSARKTVVIGLAAAMALGTTVLAGTGLYRLYSQKFGKYGVQTQIGENGQETETNAPAARQDANDAGEAVKLQIPDIKVELHYLPAGMVQAESTKYRYETDTEWQGGISFVVYAMDLGDEAFRIQDTDIVSHEEIRIADHDGVYLERQRSADGSTSGILYVFYPESHHVLEMMIGPDVSREEAVKIAEGMELVELEEGEKPDMGMNWAWSSYLEAEEETEVEGADPGFYDTVAEADMENTHSVGEAFLLPVYAEDVNGEMDFWNTAVTGTVTSVQVGDDLSLLNDFENIPENWLAAVGENGALPPEELRFVKRGDGVDTLDEIVRTETVDQKLVLVGIEYANTGDQELRHILVESGLIPIEKDGEAYALYDRGAKEADGVWDEVEGTGVAHCGEIGLGFLSLHTDYGNGGNFIETLKPGETETVWMAWVVDEDQLDYLYLAAGSYPYQITREGLDIGYVDLGL